MRCISVHELDALWLWVIPDLYNGFFPIQKILDTQSIILPQIFISDFVVILLVAHQWCNWMDLESNLNFTRLMTQLGHVDFQFWDCTHNQTWWLGVWPRFKIRGLRIRTETRIIKTWLRPGLQNWGLKTDLDLSSDNWTTPLLYSNCKSSISLSLCFVCSTFTTLSVWFRHPDLTHRDTWRHWHTYRNCKYLGINLLCEREPPWSWFDSLPLSFTHTHTHTRTLTGQDKDY